MDDESREYGTSFAVLAAAVLTGAVADICGRPVGEVRRRGIDWAVRDPRAPRTRPERAAAAQAQAWLLGAPAVIPARLACEVVGIRPERVLAVLATHRCNA